MPSNKLIVAAVMVMSCVAAAAGGAALATWRSTPAIPAASVAPLPAPTPSATPAASPTAVQESEGVIPEDPAKVAKPERGSAPATAVEREEERTTPATTTRGNGSSPRKSTGSTAPARREPPRTARNDSAGSSGTTQNGGSSSSSSTVAHNSTEPVEPSVRAQEPAQLPSLPPRELPEPAFEELVVSSDSVMGLQIETALSSEVAKVEDKVDARVTRDVKVGGRVAIPAGSKVSGSVTLVERGGKFKERARLGVRFHTIVLADGSRVPMQTETIFREGDGPGNESAAKIGGAAVGGAILGAILGGKKGAAVGATVGAAGGTAAVAGGGRNPASLPAGSTVTVRVMAPVTVTVEKEN